MNRLEITSFDNPLIKEYRRLLRSRDYRRAAGKLALEGPRLLQEAISAGCAPAAVLYTRAFRESKGGHMLAKLPVGVRQAELPEPLFSRLAETETPQGVAAMVNFSEPEASVFLAKPLSLVLILDRIQDPGNMGTMLRTALTVGVDAVFYTPGSVDPYSPKVLRSTAGAVFHLDMAAAPEPSRLLRELQQRGLRLLSAQPGAAGPYWDADLTCPIALIIGNESSGIAPELAALADASVSIPQASPLDSLNAAVAAAVILYEALRQRTKCVIPPKLG